MHTEKQETIKRGPNIFLYSAALTVHIASYTCGLAFSWSSPVGPKLQSDDNQNPLGAPLTVDEISWLASLLSLGSAVGPFVGGYLADKIGRKRTLILCIIPSIACFLILAFAKNLLLYYVIRFIMGACVGIFLTVVPMYIGEIAEIHNRGILGNMTALLIAFGILSGYTLGPYVSVKLFNLLCVIPQVIFLVSFALFVPETPYYLIMVQKDDEAEKSLQKFRLGDVGKEFHEINATVKKSFENKGNVLDIFKTKCLLKGLIVTVGVSIVQQCTGIGVVIYYMQTIFDSAGSTIPTELSAIIMSVIQVLSTIASSSAIEKLGRRPLLLISTISTSTFLILLSAYFYLLTSNDMTNITWLPILILMLYNISYYIGIGPIPGALLCELFPPNVKSAAASLTISSCFTISFLITKIFPLVADSVGYWLGFMLFVVCNIVGVVFIWYVVPETKGKTLAEILELLK